MIYPVTVTMPDGTSHARAKVFATLDHTAVYVWPDGTPEPAVLVEADAPPERGRQSRTWTLATEGGVVQLVQGCGGCNPSRLRRWQPTPGAAVRTDVSTG